MQRDAVSSSGSQVSLVFWRQEWLIGYNPVQLKFECKEVGQSAACENSRAVHISPHNSITVIGSEKSSIKTNRKSTWAFQRAVDQDLTSPLTSQKWGSDTQIWRFSHKCWQKPLKVCYRVSFAKNFQRQSCSATKLRLEWCQHLAGHDPITVKFRPKGTHP